MRLLLFGFGYSARAVAERLRPRLTAAWGTTRDAAKMAEIEARGVTPLLFDAANAAAFPLPFGEGSAAQRPGLRRAAAASAAQAGEGADAGTGALRSPPHPALSPQGRGGARYAQGGAPARGTGELAEAIAQADHVLVSAGPDAGGDPVLSRFAGALAAARPRALVYLSTVGVYGDHGGAWVDEASECRPVSLRSRQRLAAEQAWQAFGAASGTPVAIVRLAGIYGAGRGPFEKIRRGTARRIVKPEQVFNRIHVDDIAAIVEAAFARRADGVFNGSDDEPAPPQDVLFHAAELLGLPPPPELPFDTVEFTPMARSFYGENKRVRNDKIKRELGVELAYPTYREGLKALLLAETQTPLPH